jgi:hypothetical protein
MLTGASFRALDPGVGMTVRTSRSVNPMGGWYDMNPTKAWRPGGTPRYAPPCVMTGEGRPEI